jgi:membrane protein YdbS with pleckstrin-like domain
VAAPSQRRALGALFLVLAISVAGIAWAASEAEQWIIAAAAAVIALWLAVMAIRALRA